MPEQERDVVGTVWYWRKNREAQKKYGEADPKRRLVPVVVKLLIFAAVVFVLFFMIFGLARVQGVSMEPSMKDGDLLVIYRLKKQLKTGDVAVVRVDGKQVVARVASDWNNWGCEIDITEEGLTVNGKKASDPYGYGVTERFLNGPEYPIELRSGEYFLLGDNRPVADDSRIFGKVTDQDIVGVVIGMFRRRGF